MFGKVFGDGDSEVIVYRGSIDEYGISDGDESGVNFVIFEGVFFYLEVSFYDFVKMGGVVCCYVYRS